MSTLGWEIASRCSALRGGEKQNYVILRGFWGVSEGGGKRREKREEMANVPSWEELYRWFGKVCQSCQVALVIKNPPAKAGDTTDLSWIPGLERFRWRTAWQPTAVFLLRESHGQRSLVAKSQTRLKQLSKPAYQPYKFTRSLSPDKTFWWIRRKF